MTSIKMQMVMTSLCENLKEHPIRQNNNLLIDAPHNYDLTMNKLILLVSHNSFKHPFMCVYIDYILTILRPSGMAD